jgi:hypothetical protein
MRARAAAETGPVLAYYPKGQGTNEGRVALDRIGDAGKVFELEPWLRWWIAERRGTWVAAQHERSGYAPPALRGRPAVHAWGH